MAAIIWTQLNNITECVSRDPKYYASKLPKAIFELTAKLAFYPAKGKPVPELRPSAYKEILFKKYRIIYRIELNNIYLIPVHHSSRLLSNNNTFKDIIK